MIEAVIKGKVVIDNTVLSNFSKAVAFGLIEHTLKGIPIITMAVKEESFVEAPVKSDVEKAIESGWLQVEELKGIPQLTEYYALTKKHPANRVVNIPKLGDGEAASLVFAKHNNCILATDDDGPRRYAKNIAVPTIGTIAIIYLAHTEKGIIDIDVCDTLFQTMKSNGVYFPKRYRSFYDCLPELERKFAYKKGRQSRG